MRALQRRGVAAPELPTLYGLAAEFGDSEALLEAARQAHAAGYTRMDAYSPFPIEGLDEAVGFKGTKLPWVVLVGGLTGLGLGILMIWYATIIDYPILINGRSYFNWQTSIPIFFEITILFSAFTTAIAMVVMNGLPRPYHPMFNVPNFERASRDAFFLAIEATDPKFDRRGTRQFLESLHPKAVSEVEN
jgi:hypothetical protein